MESTTTQPPPARSPGVGQHGVAGGNVGPDELITFRDRIRVDVEGTSVSVTSPASTFTLRPVSGGVQTALRRLADGPTPVPALLAELTPLERVQFQRFLARAGHLVVRCVVVGQLELMRLEPTARGVGCQPVELTPDTPVRLSRFAFCRSREHRFVLESPLAKLRAVLTHRAARELVASLGGVHTVADLATDELSVADTAELLGYLVGAGFVDSGMPTGRFAADDDLTLRQWDFHDLLFHSRIRSGRYDDPIGGLYPHMATIDPQPAVKEPPSGPSIELYRPELADIVARDSGLTVAIEGRRSIRSYGEAPLTLRQLGEFLYRVGRVRVHRKPGATPGDEIVGRPYPAGGSSYELELYLTVRRCDGLAPGIYYFDPVAHRLILINEDALDREALLNVASQSTGMEANPDVLITMTSRFQRLSWKYSGIAYSMTLRHTGVLYQTMYLVAAAMGLAPCGLGIGDADLATRALRLDYLRESSVGDFLLGSNPGELESWRPDEGWHMVNDAEWALWASSELRSDAAG